MADLQAQYQIIRRDVDAAVLDVLENGRYILGENVGALEKEVADYCGAVYGVGVNSGTDALILALSALGIGPGDEVVTTPFTFVATTEAIVLLGAKPIYADIDPATFNVDVRQIEAKVTDKTKAILAVHLYGQAADVDGISELAARHGLKVVYDAAQAIGAQVEGKPIGEFGDAVTLSFFPTKNLGAAGDAGMVLTNDPEIEEKLRYLRFHGSAGTYTYRYVGYCSRLDEIQAAVLRAKLPYLDKWTNRRRRNAEQYRSVLSGLDLVLPADEPRRRHVYHQFTIRCLRRDRLKEYLKSKGIGTGVYYPSPLHLEAAYRHIGCQAGDLPEAESACQEVLSLPIFPEISDEQLAHVGKSVREFFGMDNK